MDHHGKWALAAESCLPLLLTGCAATFLPQVGPPEVSACLEDDRVMPRYAELDVVWKQIVSGIRQGRREIHCYWGISNPLAEIALDTPVFRCMQEGNDVCTVLLSGSTPAFISSDSARGMEILSYSEMRAQEISRWRSSLAEGQAPRTVVADASTTIVGSNTATSGPSADDYRVIWNLIGAFAEGVATGYARSQPRPSLGSTRRAREPLTCMPLYQFANQAATYRCQ
jgi:hypothetical protein